ncbi:2508_t:CDS:1, partial [Ambispora leptoticha]
MSSLVVSGIAPFLDFAGLSMFVEKISIYLLIGATFYFSRITKQDNDIKHNSDPSTRDTTFNEILANRDARFLTELTDYRAKFNAELTSRDESFTAEVQRILIMLNTSTARLDEIEQVLQNYHNNFGRVATEFESINASIVTLQTKSIGIMLLSKESNLLRKQTNPKLL